MEFPRLLSCPWVVRALAPLEAGYRLGLRLDDCRRRRHVAAGVWPQRLPCRVISIGNLVVGGVGKTPLVEAIAREWLRRGGRPAILSRGYRGGAGGNDEYRLLVRRLAEVPHRQHPDRYRAGLELLRERPDIDLILLDDGFQHRRLHRDLDLVALDLTRPFGYGHCLPRGLLREPWQALGRADAFILTRGEDCSPIKRAIVETFLRERFPRTPRIAARLRFEGLRGPSGASGDMAPSRRWAAFAGIGNPDAFFRSLPLWGIQPVAARSYPDHHGFTAADLEHLVTWARSQRADALVCTEKDGVKLEALPGFAELALPCYQVQIGFDLGQPHPLDLR
ncbi:MAG: tetraacyldisaccharide 4'-kinase [Planctomycetota bacterium]